MRNRRLSRPARSSGQYAVRRATTLLVTLLLATGITAFAVSRDRGAPELSDVWNVVVVQEPSGEVSMVDTTGATVDDIAGNWFGVDDIGPSGTLLLGAEGQVSRVGIGVLDPDRAVVDTVVPALDSVLDPWPAPYLASFDFGTAALQIIDAASGSVADLSGFVTEGVSDFSQMLLDPIARVLAFTAGDGESTVSIDLAAQEIVRLDGSLVDLAAGKVLTLSRSGSGDTATLALYDASDDEPVATVRAEVLAAMLTGETTAVGVTRSGSVVAVVFEPDSRRGTVTVVDDLGPVLRGPVSSAVARMDRDRLVVFAPDVAVALDADGNLVGRFTVDHDAPTANRLDVNQRCALVYGTSRDPATLIDVSSGAVIGTLDAAIVLDRADDGCTIAYRPVGSPTASRVLGPALDRSFDGTIVDLAPDASAALVADRTGVWLAPLVDTTGTTGTGTGTGGAEGADGGLRLLAPGAVDAAFAYRTPTR